MDAAPPPNRWRVPALLACLLVAALAAAAVGWRRALVRESTVAQLRQELTGLAAEAVSARERLGLVQTLEAEVERLQRDTRELHSLRGQFQEWQRLKADYEKLQAENQALQQAKDSMAQSLREATATPAATTPREAWIGVTLDPAFEGGAKVQTVVPGSPAATTGLVDGDVITAVDGQPVRNSEELRNAIAAKRAGQVARINIQRGGQARSMILRTAAFPR